MEKGEAKRESPSGLPRSHNHDDATTVKPIGRKRPRRSTSSSQKNYSEIGINDGINIEGDKDGKMASSSIPPPPPNTTNGQEMLETEPFPPPSATDEDKQQMFWVDPNPPVVAAIGVSLPWFERGGSFCKRPPSLLWDAPKTDDSSRKGKRKRVVPKRDLSKHRPRVKIHFAGVPIASKMLGVCAECGIAEEDDSGATNTTNNDTDNGNGNVVVLCDGPGCDRELHLKCCRPPLQQVPEDEDFYCFDCHPSGGYAVTLLNEYLDETEEDREAHNEELLWVEDLLETSYKNNFNDCEKDKDNDSTLSTKSNGKATSLVPHSSKSPATPNKRKRRIAQIKTPTPNNNSSSTKNNNSNNVASSGNNRAGKSGGGVSISSKFTFVDKLIFEDMKENQPDLLSQLMNGICSDAVGKGPPCSELGVFHCGSNSNKPTFRSNQTSPMESKNHHDINDADDDDDDDPPLVGCAVRLYCPKTNHYHTGRILKIREPPDNRDPNNIISEDYDRNHDTECLVRFPAGRDFRKMNVTRWIRLEEHSLAVAFPYLVWGKFGSSELEGSSSSNKGSDSKKSKKSSLSSHRWVPTKLWMRSSRELVMSMQLLDESLGQIGYRDFRQFVSSTDDGDASASTSLTTSLSQRSSPRQLSSIHRNSTKNGKSHGGIQEPEIKEAAATTPGTADSTSSKTKSYLQNEWILAECIGREIYKLVHLSTETKNYYCLDDSGGSTSPKTKKGGQGKTNGSSNNNNNKKSAQQNLSTRPRENQIMFALVQAEREERNRVRLWNKLPLQNAWHEKALTCLDEYSLEPLSYDASYNYKTNIYGAASSDSSSDYNIYGGEEVNKDHQNDEEGNPHKKTIAIQPTPLVRTGLDRMYILEQFVSHFNKTQESNGIFDNTNNTDALRGTKDMAMSLTSEVVSNHSVTACIQEQNRMARMRQKEDTVWEQQQQSQAEKNNLSETLLTVESASSPVLMLPDAIDTNSIVATPGVESVKSVQELSDDRASKADETTKADAGQEPEATTKVATEAGTEQEPEPKMAQSIVPTKEFRNFVVAQKKGPSMDQLSPHVPSMQAFSNDQTWETAGIVQEPEPKTAQTIGPTEESRNLVVAQKKAPPLDQLLLDHLSPIVPSLQVFSNDQTWETAGTEQEPESKTGQTIVPTTESNNLVVVKKKAPPLDLLLLDQLSPIVPSLQVFNNDQTWTEQEPEPKTAQTIVATKESRNLVVAQKKTPPLSQPPSKKSVQGFSNDQASKVDDIRKLAIAGTEAEIEAATEQELKLEQKTAQTIVLKEESRDVVVAQKKTPPLSKSPTSLTGIPLLVVQNETKTTVRTISSPSSRVETIVAPHTEATPSTTITPSVAGPEILLSKESTSVVSTSVPASS